MFDITERWRAEAERDRFFTQSHNLLFVAGVDGYFKRLNPAWETALGYSLNELLAHPFLNAVHPDDRAAVTAEVERLATGQYTHSFECRSLCKDGAHRWFLWNVTPSPDRAEMYGTGHDITLRKQVEADLRERMMLATLSAEVGQAITRRGMLRDMLYRCADSMVKNLGAAFARIWTLNEAENMLELQASAGMYTHLHGPHARVPVGQFKIGRIAQAKAPHLTNDVQNGPWVGDPEWARREGMVAFAGHPLLIDNRLVGVMAMFARQPLSETVLEAMSGVANQIALGIERKGAEETKAHLAAIVDSAEDAIFSKNPQGVILSWNAGAERLFGYRAQEIIGKNIGLIIPPDCQDEEERILHTFQRGEVVHTFETVRLHKDGRRIDVALTISPIRDAAGVITGASKIIRDITERKRLEEQFRQAQKMEAVGQLAGGVAHDFNNLLTIINGYGELVLGSLPAGDPNRKLIGEMVAAGDRAAGLTRQLLAFSRKTILEPKVLDLKAVVTDVDKMLRRIIGEDIHLNVVAEPETGRGEGRPRADRAGAAEPGGQRPRRHAARGAAHHRTAQRRPG